MHVLSWMPAYFQISDKPLHNSFFFGFIPTLKDALPLLLSHGHHHQLHSIATHHQASAENIKREGGRKYWIELRLLAITTPLVMARTLPLHDHLVEEDCIDLDISSITFLCYTISSPPRSREIEFQVSTNPRDGEATSFPADELFYNEKLVPLHHPPRLQTVQNLLQSSTGPPHGEFSDALEEEKMATATPTTTKTNTPFESRTINVSPDTCCRVNGELNSEKCCFECSTGIVQSKLPKKSWSKRLKSIRQSSLGLGLKASQAYLKSLFTKSGCSNGSCELPKANKECSNGYVMAGRKDSFGQIQRDGYQLVAGTSAATLIKSIDGGKPNEEESSGHRKSLSGIIKWNSTMKSSSCSSSSSFASANSSGYYQPRALKRSSSVNSEVESSIQGAIAHCKKSQQLACARKSASDVGYYSLSAPMVAATCEEPRQTWA